MTESWTPSGVAASRIKEARRVRGWSVRQLAERCAAAGAPELTDNVIENIERGRQPGAARRGRDVTIDQWMILAYVLDTPPMALVLPALADAEYRITSQVSEPAARVAQWLAGLRPLRPLPVPDPDNPGNYLPQHPGANAEREKRFYAALPAYLASAAPLIDSDVEEDRAMVTFARALQYAKRDPAEVVRVNTEGFKGDPDRLKQVEEGLRQVQERLDRLGLSPRGRVQALPIAETDPIESETGEQPESLGSDITRVHQ